MKNLNTIIILKWTNFEQMETKEVREIFNECPSEIEKENASGQDPRFCEEFRPKTLLRPRFLLRTYGTHSRVVK